MAWRIISLFLSAILLCVSAHYPNKPSPYEVLQQYKFPVGLLPKGITGYRLNKTTGEFSAHLNGSCSFTLENTYELRYKPEIKGFISQGRLQNLSGVSVKVVLLWLSIVEVKRNNEKLKFSVGFTSADFPVENFEECPQCGCGLDCGKGNAGMEQNWSSFLLMHVIFSICEGFLMVKSLFIVLVVGFVTWGLYVCMENKKHQAV